MVVNPEWRQVPKFLGVAGLWPHSSPQHFLLGSISSSLLTLQTSVNPFLGAYHPALCGDPGHLTQSGEFH